VSPASEETPPRQDGPDEGVPTAAAALGYAGALPFVGAAFQAVVFDVGEHAWGIQAIRAYGACILSFMGGVHWGLAIAPSAHDPTWPRLAAGVLPSLVGWLALLFPMTAGLILLAIAFAGLLAYDLHQVRAGRAPAWYPLLRWPLTAIVLACLLLGLVV